MKFSKQNTELRHTFCITVLSFDKSIYVEQELDYINIIDKKQELFTENYT